MSDSSKSNWDSLAEDIGAQPREATSAQQQSSLASQSPTTSTPTTSTPTTPAPTTPAPDVEYQEPTRPSSGWDSLLGDFGIDAPPPEPAPPNQQAAAEVVEPPAPPTKEAAPAVQSEVIEAAAQVSQTEVFEATTTPEVARDDAFGVEQETGDRSSNAAHGGEAAPPNRQDAATTEATPSKWDIPPKSQLSLPDWFPFAGKRSKPTIEAAPSEALEEPQAPSVPEEATNQLASEAPSDATTEPSGDQRENEARENEAREGEEPEGEERPVRRRRRRGRRRRSGVPSDAPTTAQEEAAEAVEESAAALGPNGDSLDNADDDDEGEEDTDESRTPKHRSVPSWTEAIGVVVDANIAARSERKKSSPRGGSNGGGRGRRGGRRRGGRKTSS